MLLPSMTYIEIDKTYRQIIQDARPKIDAAARKFGGIVKKTRVFPCSRVIQVETKEKTTLHLAFRADKPSKWDSPKLCIYSSFYYKDGLNAISISGTEGEVDIYTAHFFKRYKERLVKDRTISSEDLIKRFMLINTDMLWYKNSSIFSLAYKKHEREEVTQLATRIEEGNCFAERLGPKLIIMKTYISDDMLGEEQYFAFEKLDELRHLYSHVTNKK